MARSIHKLTAQAVKRLNKPGNFSDGGNLYLQISKSGSKSWLFRYSIRGKRREMGLGSVRAIPLKDARQAAERCRDLVAQGLDPVEQRKAQRVEQENAGQMVKTFDECAKAYIATHSPSWKNPKHRQQWATTLRLYVSPIMGAVSVGEVDLPLVRACLEPIWTTKTETATRVRGRIERILDWATVNGYREGENPARWRGFLDQVLPKPAAVAPVQHFAALPYAEIGRFMRALKAREGSAARALEFLIYTGARSGEVLGTRWEEINTQTKIWTIPANRMKSGREHRVPLSTGARRVLFAQRQVLQNEWVFPSPRIDRHLSNMSMANVLKRMGYDDITVHGFRSTFRDWISEETSTANIVAEMALAHTIGNAAEAAYRRGDLFERRVALMDTWSRYIANAKREDKRNAA